MQLTDHWSSSAIEDIQGGAWRMSLNHGFVTIDIKHFVEYVWPVRGGR